MNAAKQLRLACERGQEVVVQWKGKGGAKRQTPPVYVLAVDRVFAGGQEFDVALLDNGTRRSEPFPVACSKVTLVHPVIEEPPEEN